MRPKPGGEGGEVMRMPDSSEASMARINGILIRSAIVVAIAATIVLPLLRLVSRAIAAELGRRRKDQLRRKLAECPSREWRLG